MLTRHLLGWKLAVCVLLSLGAACTTAPNTVSPTPTPTMVVLTPYSTPTKSATILTPNPLTNAQSTALPQPSATPFLYEIQKDDTLSVIAYRHNIALEELLAANPGIDPNFLSIGTKIIIPEGEGNFAIGNTATPFPVQVNQPSCYSTSDGGLWCLALLENLHAQAIENVTASIALLSTNGDLLAQQTALPPTNMADAESIFPVAAFFPAPVPPYSSSRIQLLSALQIIDTSRYLESNILIEETFISSTSAILSGTVNFPQDQSPAQHLVIAAIAYDQYGNPIGIRKTEITIEEATNSLFPFEIQVFSLGPSIAKVDIFSEARP